MNDLTYLFNKYIILRIKDGKLKSMVALSNIKAAEERIENLVDSEAIYMIVEIKKAVMVGKGD